MWTDGWLNTLTLFAITFVALIYLLRKWFQADADELQWQIDSLKPNTLRIPLHKQCAKTAFKLRIRERPLCCQPVVEDGVPSLSIRS